MKIKNKKTGEIVEATDFNIISEYNSLAELNEDWEDMPEEEPKEWWFIDSGGEVVETTYITDYDKTNLRKFGNYFETKEEAEKAVEKLRAWKRLKDKGFDFTDWYRPDGCEPFIVVETNIDNDDVENKDLQKDLELLFGE